MAGSMASGFGFVWGSLLTHTGIASIIGAGGYSLYEISHGEETKGLADLFKVAFSAITLGQNVQITIHGGNSGGTVSNSGALILNGAVELEFVFSGEVTVEQGMVVIQGVAGNPSGGSSTGNAEEKIEKEITEVSKDDLPENVKESYEKYEKSGWKGNYPGQTSGTRTGREYDVNNKIFGLERDGMRFVVGSDGAIYFTEDHYNSFVKMKK